MAALRWSLDNWTSRLANIDGMEDGSKGHHIRGSRLQEFPARFGNLLESPNVRLRSISSGEIIDMLVDANNAISYVFDHIHEYGGDVRNVTLAGQVHQYDCKENDRLTNCRQSAGAHLSSLCLLRQSQWERVESRVAWKTSCLRRFIGKSVCWIQTRSNTPGTLKVFPGRTI
uniref:Uncharacterized protein n=1 Tax=Spongospora subterranea TaxID=70186 RepID=A0A0H5QSQ6_9EUKA|eukprot:CRZ04717.1 hypothetical protein [Spongospora subterranea]